MGRLRKCLKGKARETVAAMLAVPDNLTMVMACLERRFGRPDVIVQALIKRARSLTSPKNGDMIGLIDLSNADTNLVSTMQLLKSDGHLRNPELRQNLVAKLPTTLQLQWGEHAQQKRTSDITLADFSTWLTARADAASLVSDLSCSQPRINTKSSGGNSKPHFAATQTAMAKKPIATTKKTTNYRCHHCNEVGHLVPSCPKFVSLPVEKRLEWVQKEERCQLCFNKRHTAKECYGRRQRCGTDGCNERHHPVLHSSPRIVQAAVQVTHTTAHSGTSTTRTPEVLLRVLPVTLSGPTGTIDTFGLCDEASTVTMVDEDLANQLGARGPVEPLTLRWTDDTTLRENHSRYVTLDIRGGEPGEFFEMCGRTSARLNLPVQTMNISAMKRRWQHLEGIPLTSATQACKPRILIGQDNAHLTIARVVHEGPPNSPVATKTKLGWVIHGNNGAVQGRVDGDIVCFSQQQDEVLHNLVKQSFQIDALGVLKKPENLRSKEDARATEIMQNTTKKVNDRWETGLLWKKDKLELPPSRDAALKRLWSVEARMDRDDGFREQYCNKINDYLGKGYARVLTEAEALCEPKNTWYLPHFAVSNPNKPNKIRLVFDAAARSHGISLNDELLTGPDRLKSLPQVLFKFRQYRVGFGSDIKEMFHQVRIREEDLPAQRFLWRGTERSKPPKTLVMDRIIFGAVSSPFSAQEIKNKNAAQFAERYLEAADAIINCHYMDDYLDSCESVAESIQLIKEVITVHGAGGFELRNFISSSREVLESLPEELRSTKNNNLALQAELPVERTLGLHWDQEDDVYTFRGSCLQDRNTGPTQSLATKREVLRTVMSIFDPLGFLASYLVTAKVLLQDVWRAGIGWNDELPTALNDRWEKWKESLEQLDGFTIPRGYDAKTSRTSPVELHVFCDASTQAYAAAAYVRVPTAEGFHSSLVMTKMRVAPLKPTSVPRLELQAAVMGSRLAQTICEGHSLQIVRTMYWTDSSTVLQWIKTETHRLKPFVAHRIGEITESTNASDWRWVPTKENVADDATRGLQPHELTGRWLSAPQFLQHDEANWPAQPQWMNVSSEHDAELKAEFCATQVAPKPSLCIPDAERFSSYPKLLRSTAWVSRFIDNLKRKLDKQPQIEGELTADEIKRAERLQCRKVQSDCFAQEIHDLQQGGQVSGASRLSQLAPILDEEGIIRLKGRTGNTPGIAFEAVQPMILDPKHEVVRLMIQHQHNLSGHHGQERVLNELRQRYWVLIARTAVRRAWNVCQACKNKRAAPVLPEMAPLPTCRLTPHVRPFTNTGVDYFGPLTVTVGRHHEKRYGVLFTCLSTRAVHLEIATSLSTDAAIMAIRRLCARRGNPAHIYSDNGTNFKGADRELKRAMEDFDQDQLKAFASGRSFEWHFNPPSAPHMGGSWERLVKSVKVALQAILHQQAPKDEVLSTVFTEAEAVVNSRPLSYVSGDADDEPSLTPFNFLIGSTSAARPPGVFNEDDLRLRKQWRVAQRLADHFWKRWMKEYLPTLTRRTKWLKPSRPVQIDDVVIICDDNMPRGSWPRGRVVAVHPGQDGIVRVVDVKTSTGVFRRPVTKLCVIDVWYCDRSA